MEASIFKLFIIIAGLFTLAYAPIYWAAGPELRKYIGPRFAASFLLLTAAGLVAPAPWAFFIACVLVLAFTVQGRTDAICRYIMLAALIPSVEWPFVIGSLYLVRVDAMVGLALGVILATMSSRSRGRGASSRGLMVQDWFVLSLLIPFWIGSNRGLEITVFIRAGFSFLLVLLPFFIFRFNLREKADLRNVMACLGVSGAILAVFACYEARFGWALFDMIKRQITYDHLMSHSLLVRGGYMRASAAMSGPLMLASYLTVAFFAMLLSRRAFRSQLVWAGCLAVILMGLIACQSRGNLVMLAVGLIVVFIAQGRWQRVAIAGAGAAVLVGGALLVSSSSQELKSFLGVNAGYTRGGEYFADYREVLLRRGIEVGLQHPLLGASQADNRTQMQDIEQSTGLIDMVNTYLLIFLVSGAVGMGIFAAGVIFSIRSLLRAKPAEKADRALWEFTITTIVVVLMQLAFMSFIDRMPLMLLLAVAASRLLAIARRSATPSEEKSLPSDGGDGLPPTSMAVAGYREPQAIRMLGNRGLARGRITRGKVLPRR